MGIIWRITMVLLSTLAALVIIVNSAEEEYEAHYRKELRPSLDAVTPRTYEQPWRTVQMEQPIQQSSEHWTEDRTDEPLRRRRLNRKRKRQPESSSAQEILSREFGFHEEHIRPYYDIDFSGERKTEPPKRRRKKLDLRRNRWDVTADGERPIRRRGQRRKRPSVEDSPEDFSDLLSDTQINTERNDDFRHFEEHEEPPVHVINDDHILAENTGLKFGMNYDILDKSSNKHNLNGNQKRTAADDDLSDVTMEELRPVQNEEHIKSKEKIGILNYGYEKAKENVDPLTLKDILKKSNGTSLSEILQQHNLSLTDLLDGKDNVLALLKSEESLENPVPPPLHQHYSSHTATTASPQPFEIKPFYEINFEEKGNKDDTLLNVQPNNNTREVVSENPIAIETTVNSEVITAKEEDITTTTENNPVEESTARPINIRRFPTSIRRKQRIRPVFNNTLKSQLSRDMLAMNARKYFNNRRRNSSHEWRDLIPMMKKNLTNDAPKKIETTTLATIIEEPTTLQEVENCTTFEAETEPNNVSEQIIEFVDKREKSDSNKDVEDLQSAIYKNDNPTIVTTTTESVNISGLRLQAFNNRLKKKRLRQKNLTTEPPQDDIMMNLFGIPNLVSSSEFISQTQGPKTSIDDVSIVEDPVTTEMSRKRHKKTRYSPSWTMTSKFATVPTSTEESAKIEIAEILNDSKTSIRLSKILRERNMTLNELVEHRERGSSHVHLADIFQNASKEPNSPEPFLSKSSIEPISKETYPLRALLDANTHDTTTKITSDTVTEVNIPVKMDFGNNVNENAENTGFMSFFPLLNNKTNGKDEKTNLKKDSEGAFYETTITVVNTTDIGNASDTARESRVIHVVNDNNPDDIVSWNDIFTLMRKNHENITEEVQTSSVNHDAIKNVPNNSGKIDDIRFQSDAGSIIEEKNIKLIEDVNGDGLIVMEDIEQLKDDKFRATSGESLDFGFHEKVERSPEGILEKIPNQTKSVTIVTSSIAGLAMVLFLLTCVGYRWHQHRTLVRTKSFAEERLPSPVFENRKGHKHNSSSRSISPMLASSNIYTLNTLDSRNGKESPDYMWDSLRKAF